CGCSKPACSSTPLPRRRRRPARTLNKSMLARPDPDWIVPEGLGEGVGAMMTTRYGGVSVAPWASLNLGVAVGDDPQAVSQNRRRMADAIGAQPVFLRQVHGSRVLRLDGPLPSDDSESADACVT